MLDLAEVAFRTDKVAQAMHNTKSVLGRAEHLLESGTTRAELLDVQQRLVGSGRELRDALGHVDALREIPQYGELKGNVESVARLVNDTEAGVEAGVANPAALREAGAKVLPRMADARASVQFAINKSNDAKKASDQAKAAQVASNPTPTSAQHAPGSALQDAQQRPDGQAQSTGVER
jgi:hypothetical protein